MKYRTLLLALTALSFTGTARTAPAQVPGLINYQGRVAVGTPGVNFEGVGQFKFALVNPTGTVTYWSNDGTSVAGSEPAAAVSLPVAKGLYSVLLGDTTLAGMADIPASAFANADVRLRVWFADGVNGSQLLTPDQRLAPAAYLADGAVTTAAIAPGAVTGTSIAPATIDGTHIAASSLDFSHLAAPGAPIAGQVLGFDGSGFNWIAPGGGGGTGNYWALNAGNIYYNAGKVGIGTATPSHRFVIADGGGQLGFSGVYIRAGILGGGNGAELDLQGGWTDNDGGRVRLGGSARGDADRNVVQFFQNNLERMRINDGGFVGIGTATPATKLHVYDAANSVSHRIHTGAGTNSWSRVEFANANGQWNVGTSRSFNSDEFYIQRNGLPITFALAASGFSSRLTVADFTLGHADRRGTAGRALVDWKVPGTNVKQLVVNFGNDWQETVIGGLVTEVKTLRITGGADLAEPFAMKEEELEKGSVVVIDDEHPGRLKRSTSAYDTRVAGIVSGANGVNPGIALHQQGALEGGQNVALSGRVYVQADATGGAIRPGDLLTTSDTPGHAMKVTEHTRAQGAILGKAMSPLEEGTGMVLVLVTLQ